MINNLDLGDILKSPINDLFSRRNKKSNAEEPGYYTQDLSEETRARLIASIFETRVRFPIGFQVDYDDFKELLRSLFMELGKPPSEFTDVAKGITDFLLNCKVEQFMDTIELLIVIKISKINEYRTDPIIIESFSESINNFIDTINRIFTVDKVGYEIIRVNHLELPFIVVPFKSKYLQEETIKRPMSLMYDQGFDGALNEFEDALVEYSKEEYKDAIHKANKAYESTLKTILDLKNVSYGNNDNIPALVEKIRNRTDLIDSNLLTIFESFWSVLQRGPPNIRNIRGIGHGQGASVKEIEKSYADFVLRLSGTYSVFLIERYNETK